MGFFRLFPCCGSKDDPTDTNSVESDALLRGGRGPGSITSQEGYGAVTMSSAGPEAGASASVTSASLSREQRARIAEIGREVGNHMLPIHYASRTSTNSPVRPVANQRITPSSSAASSRPPSPSPRRDTPPGGVLRPGAGGTSSSMGYGAASGSLGMGLSVGMGMGRSVGGGGGLGSEDGSGRGRRRGASDATPEPDADGVVRKTVFLGAGTGGGPTAGGPQGRKTSGRGKPRGRGRGRGK